MFMVDTQHLPEHVAITQTLVQAEQIGADFSAATKTSNKYDFIYNGCQGISQMEPVHSAGRVISPAGMLESFYQDNGSTFDYKAVRISLLSPPKNGLLTQNYESNPIGYWYAPQPSFLSEDRAAFLAEVNGKRYKVIVTLAVREAIGNEDPCDTELHFKPQLIKITHEKHKS